MTTLDKAGVEAALARLRAFLAEPDNATYGDGINVRSSAFNGEITFGDLRVIAARPAEPAPSADVAGMVERLRKLISLDQPENGGPYGGFAAAECMRWMAEAASLLTRVAAERDAARTEV